MRFKATVIVASAVTMCAFNSAWSQALIPQSKVKAQEAAAQAATPAPSAVQAAPSAPAGTTTATATAPTPTQLKTNCANPNAIGVSRVVSIDTTGGPGFGFEHFKQLDFLRDKEVVLTFDDGPWPVNTPSVLKTLDEECTKAIFFPVGKHATYYPEILKHVAEKGHTIGSHTWSHANLNGKKMTEETQIEEIEKGFSAVKWALGADPAPFFRAPALQHPPAMVTYLGTRNVGIWSCDLDSFDFKASKPETIVKTVMTKLDKMGKGIILMHDFQKHTGEALPELMKQLKAGGYKVVQVKAKAPVQTIAKYDEEVVKGLNLPTVSSRPVSSVVETISEVK